MSSKIGCVELTCNTSDELDLTESDIISLPALEELSNAGLTPPDINELVKVALVASRVIDSTSLLETDSVRDAKDAKVEEGTYIDEAISPLEVEKADANPSAAEVGYSAVEPDEEEMSRLDVLVRPNSMEEDSVANVRLVEVLNSVEDDDNPNWRSEVAKSEYADELIDVGKPDSLSKLKAIDALLSSAALVYAAGTNSLDVLDATSIATLVVEYKNKLPVPGVGNLTLDVEPN